MKRNQTCCLFLLIISVYSNYKLYSQEQTVKNTAYSTVTDSVIQQNNELAFQFFQESEEFKKNFNITQATKSIKKAIQLDSLNLTYLYQFADICKLSDNTKGEIQTYQKIIEIDSTLINAKFRLSNAYFKSKDYIKAFLGYQEIFSKDSTNWLALRKLALCAENIEVPNSFVLPYYWQVLALNPDDKLSKYRISALLLEDNEYEKAVDELNLFIATDSNDTQFRKNIGFAYLNIHNYDSAIVHFTKCVEENDTSFFVEKYLGLSYQSKGENQQAIHWLESALNQKTDDYQTYYFLGKANSDLLRFEQSTKYLNMAMNLLRPNEKVISKVYYELGRSYEGSDNYEMATESYNKAVQYDRENVMLYYTLGTYYYLMSDIELAEKYLSMYIDSSKAYNKVNSYYLHESENIVRRIQENKFWEGEN
ncbi:MAG: tetratricopeptide repeat protein [Bacteroidales bacterium]|nr:tetratricopeptide repeat protein [Bacteroidales bacterium]MBN2817996.1 tetratricopeptide repeat protein [Bacteroidales bacterium]